MADHVNGVFQYREFFPPLKKLVHFVSPRLASGADQRSARELVRDAERRAFQIRAGQRTPDFDPQDFTPEPLMTLR
jgi:cob(I)alamin adenosyltransferase